MLKCCANLSLLFTEVPFIERFALAKQQGFSAVEIQFPYGLPAQKLKEVMAAQELKLVLFNVDADDLLQGGEGLACVPEKRGQFQHALNQALHYAGILQPEAINVLPGCCFDANRYNEYLQTFKDNLLQAANAFAPLGIKTVFEAINTEDMPGFIIHNGQQMLEVLSELQHPNLWLQYDIYHMSKMAEDVPGFMHQHTDKIGHLQFADCPGRGQPGTGAIDFSHLFSVIEASGYSGWLGAEYRPVGKTHDSFERLRDLVALYS